MKAQRDDNAELVVSSGQSITTRLTTNSYSIVQTEAGAATCAYYGTNVQPLYNTFVSNNNPTSVLANDRSDGVVTYKAGFKTEFQSTGGQAFNILCSGIIIEIYRICWFIRTIGLYKHA